MSLTVDPAGTIRYTRGDDEVLVFDLKDSNGTALSVAGQSFFFTVKYDIDDDISVAKFQKTVGAGITVQPGGVTGRVTVACSSADVSGLAGRYVCDLLRVDGSGARETYGPFPFIVPKNVSTPGVVPSASSPIAPFPGSVSIAGYLYVFSVVADGGDGLWHKYGPDPTVGLLRQFDAQATVPPF